MYRVDTGNVPGHTKESMIDQAILPKSPLAPLYQRGEFLPLVKGGKEGFSLKRPYNYGLTNNRRRRTDTRRGVPVMKSARIFLILVLTFIIYGCAADYGSQYVKPPERPAIQHVYQEQDKIVAYFGVNNAHEYQKLVPSIFRMPPKPLCRVSVIDFYDMIRPPLS